MKRVRIIFIALALCGVGIGWWWRMVRRDPSIVFIGPPPLKQWDGPPENLAQWSFADGVLSASRDFPIWIDAHLPDQCTFACTIAMTPHLGGTTFGLFEDAKRYSKPSMYDLHPSDIYYLIDLDWSGVSLTRRDQQNHEAFIPGVETEYFYHRTRSRIEIACDRTHGYFRLSADGERLAEWRGPQVPASCKGGICIQAFANFSVRDMVVKHWDPRSELGAEEGSKVIHYEVQGTTAMIPLRLLPKRKLWRG